MSRIAPHPAVVVHGLAHARLALAIGRPVTLLSGAGAGVYAGVGWWQAMIVQARRDVGTDAIDVLDCGDAAGRAAEALRVGQTWLILEQSCPAYAAIADIAAAANACLLTARPAALDLAQRGAERRLASWLR